MAQAGGVKEAEDLAVPDLWSALGLGLLQEVG